MNEITNALYAKIDRLTAQITKLEKSRDEWKRISLEAKAWIEEVLLCMREIGVAELEMERGHQEAAIAALEEANNSLAARVAELEAWKESALATENLWDVQAVGREIGVDLGEPIRSQILPYIKRLKATLKNIR